MEVETVQMVRRAVAEWQDLVARLDEEGLEDHFRRYYDPDVWVDFGSRTPDALPGKGIGVMLDWTRKTFAQARASDAGLRYHVDGDPVVIGDAVVVSGHSTARLGGMNLETRFASVYRVREGKVVSMTMHTTLEGALEAARENP